MVDKKGTHVNPSKTAVKKAITEKDQEHTGNQGKPEDVPQKDNQK
jgi:hypothetical protein